MNTSSGDSGHIVLAGGSGFLGRSVARFLVDRGERVVTLGRSVAPKDLAGWFQQWDARRDGEWRSTLRGAKAVVNLSGRSVDCVKTPDHCDEILRSRVEATLALGEACRRIDNPPRVWVQMSTAHIYGDPPSLVCDESSPFGYGLAPQVGEAWEDACDSACPDDIRCVKLRTSFVVDRRGGAISRLAPLAKLGLGGAVGSGKQGMSWIHHRDMNRIFEAAINNDAMEGAYIASAPHPVSNRDFMRALRGAVGMPLGLPAPSLGVRIVAPLILKTDPELALYGRYCVPTRLLESGSTFDFPTIDAAMVDIFGRQ